MRYDAVLAETIGIRGHGDDLIEAYTARPMDPGPHPGMIVIHHMPGYDAGTKEITRRFATMGYSAICPNLYTREAPDADPDDAAATARANGGVPDERFVGDASGAAAWLRTLPNATGAVGVIGFCSGGRQSVLTGIEVDVQAAVDCYGAFVVGTPPEGFPLQVSPLADRIGDLGAPLLGLFGNDDSYPSPDQVDELESAPREAREDLRVPPLRRRRARVLLRRPAVLPARGRRRRLGKGRGLPRHPPRPEPRGSPVMCTYSTEKVALARSSGKTRDGWATMSEATVYYDHPVHAPDAHTVNIDFLAPERGAASRIAVELSLDSARELLAALQTTVERAEDH